MSPTRAHPPPPASESKTEAPESPVLILQSRAGDTGRSVLHYGSQGCGKYSRIGKSRRWRDGG
jgi:hypothetical protein